ncbi:MAG: adenylate/guanylate cyclase domain-containing protein [Rhodocyclales bacterium GT-UBC]|nr:MAG: adenylate/guanylate cyclase domain-containing protein [Rhodocyclales bacterium GT-UBC]
MRLAAKFDSPLKIAFGAAILSLFFWLVLVASFSGAIRLAEELSGDWVWRVGASTTPERRIVIVDIDEGSLRQLGPWPWSRSRLAELSDQLAAHGAALQVFDIVFPAASRDDAAFAARLKKNNGVLSQVFALQGDTEARSGEPASFLPWLACPAIFPEARGYIANAPGFGEVPVGHITPLVSRDGAVRHQPAVVCHDGKAYPALFLSALMLGTGTAQISLAAGSGALASAWELNGLPLHRNGVPLDERGNVRVPWHVQPEAFVALSAQDVLAGKVPSGLLQNSWVLVGSTALGLNDRIATPFSGIGAGMLVHAELLRGLLDEDIPSAPMYADAYAGLATLAGVVVLTLLARLRRKPVFIILGSALCLIALLYLAKALLLLKAGLWFEWVGPALYWVLFAMVLSLLEHARSRLERDRIYAHLSSYLPGPVAAALASSDPSDAIDASRKNVSVLFADIRNFSAYCESRPPEEATAVLHAFFSMATQVVEKHGGMIESFQGDAVLAVWGAGGRAAGSARDEAQDVGENAERALDAAIEMFKESRLILPAPPPEGLEALELGIGLETGGATVGSFGLARRRTHLAMGRTITTAARLEQMTAELAHPILVGEGMAASLGKPRLESQGVFLLEGMKTPCHIYAYPLRHCV